MTLQRWKQLVDWPLMIASLVFMVAYSVQVFTANAEVTSVAGVTITITWSFFVVEYVVSLLLAPQRLSWFFRHIHELAIVALPVLRPLRLLRLLTVLTMVQKIAGNALRGRVLMYVLATSVLLLYIAALAIYDVERGATNASIVTFGDALWWAVTTVTTVGYGDLAPVTTTGRIIAIGLMLWGITLLGIITATTASWLVSKVSEDGDNAPTTSTSQELEALRADIAYLRTELAEQTPPPPPPPDETPQY